MAIDEKLTQHVRGALTGVDGVHEVKMFGGIGFMLNGNMIAAASDRGLLVRVGEVGTTEALTRPGAQPMSMNGRIMKGYVRITATLDARSVKSWLRLARAFVETLPAKTKAAKKKAARKKTSKKKPAAKRSRKQPV